MTAAVRNRLLLLGSAWGMLLAALPALVMTRHLSGFLVAALLVAALSGSVGTLVAGRRPAPRGGGGGGGLFGVGKGVLLGGGGGGGGGVLLLGGTAPPLPQVLPRGAPSLLRPRL